MHRKPQLEVVNSIAVAAGGAGKHSDQGKHVRSSKYLRDSEKLFFLLECDKRWGDLVDGAI